MDRFSRDNTEGYSAADLAELNAAFSARLDELRSQGVNVDADDIGTLSMLDQVAEQVLADFDTQHGGAA